MDDNANNNNNEMKKNIAFCFCIHFSFDSTSSSSFNWLVEAKARKTKQKKSFFSAFDACKFKRRMKNTLEMIRWINSLALCVYFFHSSSYGTFMIRLPVIAIFPISRGNFCVFFRLFFFITFNRLWCMPKQNDMHKSHKFLIIVSIQ